MAHIARGVVVGTCVAFPLMLRLALMTLVATWGVFLVRWALTWREPAPRLAPVLQLRRARSAA